MSASESGSRGGQPSTTAPIATPCDSPQVVSRNTRPKLLPIAPNPFPLNVSPGLRAGGPSGPRGGASPAIRREQERAIQHAEFGLRACTGVGWNSNRSRASYPQALVLPPERAQLLDSVGRGTTQRCVPR